MKGLIRKILKEELLLEGAMPSKDKIIELINNTVSYGGSKNYDDLIWVKGETAVGILHFTTRGLRKLYKEMDTEHYFNKSEDEMIDFIKEAGGKELNYAWWAKGMSIKKNNPKRRKSFRARHNCDNPGPKWKARYWSCKKW